MDVSEGLPAECPWNFSTQVQTLPTQRVLSFPEASLELRTNVYFLRWSLGNPGPLALKGC